MSNQKELIFIQNSHVTQHTNANSEKTEWSVQKNESNEELYTLPKHWDESTVFTALDFAKKFELEALNVGINFGVSRMVDKHNRETAILNDRIKALTEANDRLSEKLGQLLGCDE